MEFASAGEAFFLAMAQIAVAFAGFAGVIGAFSRFTTNARVVAFRVRTMVALSLHALMIALVPFALAAVGMSSEWVWRASCGYAAIQATVVQCVLIAQGVPLFRERLLKTGYINLVWNVAGALVVVLLYFIAFGALSAAAAAKIYVAAIVYVVLVCAYSFLMLILSVKFDE